MVKVGFGSKGYSKSSIQSAGIRTQAQSYGSVRSALTSIIPYTTNLAVWTTLDPSTISTTTSGSTTVISQWNDIINNVIVSQALTASMPAPSTTYAINKFMGVRFISDDYLFNNSVDSATPACMTYGIYMRSNTDVSVNSWIFTAPHAQAAMSPLSNERYYAFHYSFEGSALKRHFLNYAINYASSNRGFGVQPFLGNTNNKYNANDYIYYFSVGTDSSRNLFVKVFDKDGNQISSTNTSYITFLGADNTGSWDALYGGPSGPKFTAMRPVIGRSAADSVYYTQLKFGSSTVPTKADFQKITNYLESAYGKVMT